MYSILDKIISYIFVTLLLLTHGCHDSKNVYDVLINRGFDERLTLFCQISDGKTVKNINEDLPMLFKSIKNSMIVPRISQNPSYVISLQNGSAFSYQCIKLHACKSEDGYVEYLGKKIFFFNCGGLYNFCVDSFNRSTIIINERRELQKGK